MTHPSFDAAGALSLDLGRGSLNLDGKVPAMAVPAAALDALFKRAPADVVEGFARRLGTQAGSSVRERVGAQTSELTLENVTEQLGGALAVMGLGNLEMERWGKALVATLEGVPMKSAQVTVARAVVESSISQLFDRPVRAVMVTHDDARVKMLIVAPEVAAKVESWVGQGFSWGELLDKLHRGSSGAPA